MRAAALNPHAQLVWSIDATIVESIEGSENATRRRGQTLGLASGFKGFDHYTNGLQESEMIVIAAHPSMGKTAFAMNVVEHVAVSLRRFVGVFSLEMSKPQLVQRLLCSRARVDLANARSGHLGGMDTPNLSAAAMALSAASKFLLVDDTTGLSITDLKARARQMHKQSGGLSLVMIDHLQLVTSPSKRDRRTARWKWRKSARASRRWPRNCAPRSWCWPNSTAGRRIVAAARRA